MTNVIEEEDETSLPADQAGSEQSSRRPSSAGSLRSGREEKVDVQRRVWSAGKCTTTAVHQRTFSRNHATVLGLYEVLSFFFFFRDSQ